MASGSPPSSLSPTDKCVNIRLDDSQRIYLTGSGQKGSIGTRGLPGKIGPKGDKGGQGLRGIVGPRGGKGSKGEDSGITDLENRLAVAEQLITELMAFKQNITENRCIATSIYYTGLETGCSNDGIYHLQPPGVQTRFQVRQTSCQGSYMISQIMTVSYINQSIHPPGYVRTYNSVFLSIGFL